MPPASQQWEGGNWVPLALLSSPCGTYLSLQSVPACKLVPYSTPACTVWTLGASQSKLVVTSQDGNGEERQARYDLNPAEQQRADAASAQAGCPCTE